MATIEDLITETQNGANPVVTQVDSPRNLGGSVLNCESLENWPTNTAVHFQTYQLNSSNVKIAGTSTDWKAVVSGSTLEDLTYMGGALDAGNSIGDYVEMMPTYSWGQNLAEALEVLHNTDGTFKEGASLNQPTIEDLSNAQHNHTDSAEGGTLIIAGTQGAIVAALETTSSTSYTDLATTSDEVTVNIGPSGMAIVLLKSDIENNTQDALSYVSVALSGENILAASNANSIMYQAFGGGSAATIGAPILFTGLSEGFTTFKMKYQVATGGGGGGTGAFANRHISVVPL